MVNEYSRTELLIGEEGTARLKKASVVVFGVGGVGSHCIEALARSGIGRLVLVDNDTVSITNINRQSIACHSTVGRYKTEVMRERIQDICPETEVQTFETFVLADNTDPLFAERPDYIVDAIDTVAAKLALASYASANRIPLISAMGTGNKLHPELLRISDIKETSVCPLCRVMRRELKARQIPSLKVCWSPEQPLTPAPPSPEEAASGPRRSIPGSTAFVPPAAGLLMAGEAVREICGL